MLPNHVPVLISLYYTCVLNAGAWNDVIMLVIRHGLKQMILSMEGKALVQSESCTEGNKLSA